MNVPTSIDRTKIRHALDLLGFAGEPVQEMVIAKDCVRITTLRMDEADQPITIGNEFARVTFEIPVV